MFGVPPISIGLFDRPAITIHQDKIDSDSIYLICRVAWESFNRTGRQQRRLSATIFSIGTAGCELEDCDAQFSNGNSGSKSRVGKVWSIADRFMQPGGLGDDGGEDSGVSGDDGAGGLVARGRRNRWQFTCVRPGLRYCPDHLHGLRDDAYHALLQAVRTFDIDACCAERPSEKWGKARSPRHLPTAGTARLRTARNSTFCGDRITCRGRRRCSCRFHNALVSLAERHSLWSPDLTLVRVKSSLRLTGGTIVVPAVHRHCLAFAGARE